jgi:hypothetical protein
MAPLLHDHKQFSELLSIVAEQLSIEPILIEKDYWIMNAPGLYYQGQVPFDDIIARIAQYSAKL